VTKLFLDEVKLIMKKKIKQEVPHLTQDTKSLNYVSSIESNSLGNLLSISLKFNEPSVVIHTVKGFGKMKCAHADCEVSMCALTHSVIWNGSMSAALTRQAVF